MIPIYIKKQIIISVKCILTVLISTFILSPLLYADPVYADPGQGPYKVKQRPDVKFLDNYHDLHMDTVDCLDCHHVYENGENVLEMEALEDGEAEIECASCHNSESTLDITKAFHRQCMGCHNKMKKKKEKTGPSLCGECHIKNADTP